MRELINLTPMLGWLAVLLLWLILVVLPHSSPFALIGCAAPSADSSSSLPLVMTAISRVLH